MEKLIEAIKLVSESSMKSDRALLEAIEAIVTRLTELHMRLVMLEDKVELLRDK